MKNYTKTFTSGQILDLTEMWFTQGELNPEILADNFQFFSPFWESINKEQFINKFKNSEVYKENVLNHIVKFDPLIKTKSFDGKHFAIIAQYHTKKGDKVFETILGTVANGLLLELRSIYDLAETKKAFQL